MFKNKKKIWLVLLCILPLLSGCATITGRMKAESFIGGETYPSFKSKNYSYMPTFYPGGGDRMKGLGLLAYPVAMVDFPVSAVIDTVLFPIDYLVYKVRFSNSESEFADVIGEVAKSLERDAYKVQVQYDYWYPMINHKGEPVSYLDEPGLNEVWKKTVRHHERFYSESKESLVISKYENVSYFVLALKNIDAGEFDARGIENDAYTGRTLKGSDHQVKIDKVQVFETNGGISYARLLINSSNKHIYVSLRFEKR